MVALALPAVASAYWLKASTSVIIVALCSLSVALLYAQLGMVSLCQYALFGVGGWVALRLFHAFHLPFELDLLAAGLAASVCGVIFGLPALRMRGLYFALITLMIAGAFQIIINAISFPDGGPGLSGKVYAGVRQFMPHPPLAPSDAAYFRYVVAVVAIGFVLTMLIERTRVGRAWALIRRSEPVAVAMGVNIVAYKVIAFAIAGFLAGVSGALMAGSIGQLDGRAFPASESIMMFALTVIGGAFHWSGPIFAGLLLARGARPAHRLAYRRQPGDHGVRRRPAARADHRAARHFRPGRRPGPAAHRQAVRRDAARDGAEAVIEIRNLTVAFGGVRGLNDLSADIGARITGLVGPNGAGKTTLLNAMSGFVKCAGRARWSSTGSICWASR